MSSSKEAEVGSQMHVLIKKIDMEQAKYYCQKEIEFPILKTFPNEVITYNYLQ